MKYAFIYFITGGVLVAQAVLRSRNARYELRKNPIDALIKWVGVSILWPLVLAGELQELYRQRRKTKKPTYWWDDDWS